MKPIPIDMTGKRFGKLTVIKYVGSNNKRDKGALWLCLCDCGKERIALGKELRKNHILSCGCLKAQKHGYTNHPLYAVWCGMRERCYNKNFWAYANYGGRGISVCKEWNDSVSSFIKWAIDNNWVRGLQIDRIDNNGNYEPNNCRIVTPKENMRNRRNTILYQGKPLGEWCEHLGLNYKEVYRKIFERHWTFERALSISNNEQPIK